MRRKKGRKSSGLERAVSEFVRRRRGGEELSVARYLSGKPCSKLSREKLEDLKYLLLTAEALYLAGEPQRRIDHNRLYEKAKILRKLDRPMRGLYMRQKMN